MNNIITYNKRSRSNSSLKENLPPTPRKKPRIEQVYKQNLSQLQLDLGSTQTTCKQCGMSFIKTLKTDSTLHQKFHEKSKRGIEWPNPKSLEIIWKDYIGNKILVVSGIVEKRRLGQLVSLVDSELASITTIHENMKAFVYIKGTKCIGLVLAERIDLGYRAISDKTNSSCTIASDVQVDAILGISRIWVSKNHRRLRIAWKLLDISRENFLYGLVIDKDKVAFSQPSESGKKLIEKWTGRKDFVVYIET